ncbi:hypothetical protein LOD99_13789 [Oopsacas minuta]|uniref:CHCH domain-containing protein n=1 Tax=Oopsacas minuta TaxID=111878 RepID=A0AAV7KI96_9METZ|nr:hypothetical protein LOD99_13789 [Oopsacas minuta]
MSYCTKDGQDKAIFLTEEDYEKPGMLYTLTINENEWGIILPTGDINWKCPCLGGIADSPCGEEFKDAFTCFHYSEGEIKGAECIESFKKFQTCVEAHPGVYGDMGSDEDEEKGEHKDSESIKLDHSDISSEGQISRDNTSNDTTAIVPK